MGEQKHKILVVDDEPDLVDIYSFHLEMEGYEVVTARSGREAYKLLGSSKAELVISDIRMPDGDGIELLKRISTDGPQVPVIMITGYSEDEGAVTELGARALLKKPLKLQDLAKAVREILNP